MAGPRADIDLARVLRLRLRIIGSVLRSRPRQEKAHLVATFSDFAAKRLADGRLRPLVQDRFPFERIADAYTAMQAGGLFGKIVVERSA